MVMFENDINNREFLTDMIKRLKKGGFNYHDIAQRYDLKAKDVKAARKLKRCPSCGARGAINCTYDKVWCYCTKCKIQSKAYKYKGWMTVNKYDQKSFQEAEIAAIKAWNSRANWRVRKVQRKVRKVLNELLQR